MTTAHLMSPDDPMAQSGARWCTEHGRWECAANKADHHAAAIRGTRLCKNCSGRPLAAAKAIGEANLLAWSTQNTDAEKPLDPGRVVMDQLRLAVARADLFGALVRLQLGEDPVGGLVGVTRTAGREGQAVESGEQVRALVRLEAEWRDRVVRFAKTAHDMGIAERHIELEQGRAQLVVSAYLASLRVVELPRETQERMIQTFMDGLGRGELVAGEVTA